MSTGCRKVSMKPFSLGIKLKVDQKIIRMTRQSDRHTNRQSDRHTQTDSQTDTDTHPARQSLSYGLIPL